MSQTGPMARRRTQAIIRNQNQNQALTNCTTGRKFISGDALLSHALACVEKRIELEDAQGKPKSIVSNGVWQVPPDQRPRGWEKMGVKEL